MEHAVGGLRILDDVRFGGRIPTIAFLGERSAHHHQLQRTRDIRRGIDRSRNVGQRSGSHHRDIATEPTNRIDDESHAFRQCGGVDGVRAHCAIAHGERKCERVGGWIRMRVMHIISAYGNQPSNCRSTRSGLGCAYAVGAGLTVRRNGIDYNGIGYGGIRNRAESAQTVHTVELGASRIGDEGVGPRWVRGTCHRRHMM